MKLVSILLNTIDRFDLTVRCIGGALADCSCKYELLVCDNGSSDRRVVDYVKTLPGLVYHRLNESNEGCAQMHNQMLLRAKGDYFCLLDNDIELWNGWLDKLVEVYETVELSGIAAIHTTNLSPEQHPAENLNGIVVHPATPPKEDAVFGTRLFDRSVLKKVGYFCEDYGPYGLCDNEYNSRVYHSGFVNYYLDGPSAMHLGDDVGESSEYRRMKDESLRVASPKFLDNVRRYSETGNYYVPPPELR